MAALSKTICLLREVSYTGKNVRIDEEDKECSPKSAADRIACKDSFGKPIMELVFRSSKVFRVECLHTAGDLTVAGAPYLLRVRRSF